MMVTSLLVNMIGQGERLRPLSEPAVDALMESIRVNGLLQPIIIRRPLGMTPRLVAGAHRLEAFRRLGEKLIPTVEIKCSDDEALLREIDENLIREELKPEDRRLCLLKRKRLYEKMFPETKLGGDRGNQHTGGKLADRQSGELPKKRFTKDTAEKTGRSERSIQRDIARAEKEERGEVDVVIAREVKESEYFGEVKKGLNWFAGLTRVEKRLFVQGLEEKYGISNILD
jgi:ParB family transcriptional regulator, chromosome partitioning protein